MRWRVLRLDPRHYARVRRLPVAAETGAPAPLPAQSNTPAWGRCIGECKLG